MFYEHDISNCFADAIGPGGLDRGIFDGLLTELTPALDTLRTRHADNSLPLLRLPELDDIPALTDIADDWSAKFDDVVVLGAGGSSLGGRTLCALNQDEFGVDPGAPRMHFMENVDPRSFDRLTTMLNLSRTGVLTISKSGGTAETLTQFFLCLERWRSTGIPVSKNFMAISEAGENPLRAVCGALSIRVLDHDPNIGGRYSVLSLVGILPALMAGVDAAALRRGAGSVLKPLLDGVEAKDFPPATGAAIAVGLETANGISQSIFMPYSDRLKAFSTWYRQLWAESLGKQGHGTTPVDALGAVDQHSQLQLYLDGPRDKAFTIAMIDTAGTGGRVDPVLAIHPSLDWLAGRTMGDLLEAEHWATAQTLIKTGLPTRMLRLKKLSEEELGAMMMHFMLETILAAHLLKVDPFDQPAVEHGKVLTRQYLAEMNPDQK